MFVIIDSPPQDLLDRLWDEASRNLGSCSDCGVPAGDPHNYGCDVAQCEKTGAQRLTCGCGDCGADVWDGVWPGTRDCYELRFVCRCQDTGNFMFDYNRLAVLTSQVLEQ